MMPKQEPSLKELPAERSEERGGSSAAGTHAAPQVTLRGISSEMTNIVNEVVSEIVQRVRN